MRKDRAEQPLRERMVALLDRNVRAHEGAARKAPDFRARGAQVSAGLVERTALACRLGELTVVVRDRTLLRRAAGFLQLAEHRDCATPLLFLFVDAHELAHRRHSMGARSRQRLEDLLGAIEQPGLQVVLGQCEAGLFTLVGSSVSRVAMFWWILIARSTSPRRR